MISPRLQAVLRACCLSALLLLVPPAHAFPPAPHHVIYGLVRDEMGNPLAADNAEVLFEASAGTKHTAPVAVKEQPGQNYELQIPMDAGIANDLYMPTAMRPTVPFKIRVRIGPINYLPIEMSGDYASLGQPGKKTRINLTLGVDTDGDGLPDAWEQALLAMAGPGRTLADIKPGDDTDGDGMSNLDEYLAGTYAFDRLDGYSLRILRSNGSAAVLEFLAVRGRTYSVHGSSDFRQWTPMPFRMTADGLNAAAMLSYWATDVRAVEVEAIADPGMPPARFFKLMIE